MLHAGDLHALSREEIEDSCAKIFRVFYPHNSVPIDECVEVTGALEK